MSKGEGPLLQNSLKENLKSQTKKKIRKIKESALKPQNPRNYREKKTDDHFKIAI